MVAGAAAKFNLSPEDIALSEQNCQVYCHKELTGIRFLKGVVEPVLKQDRPDIIIINPLQAYLGADVKDTEKVSRVSPKRLKPAS